VPSYEPSRYLAAARNGRSVPLPSGSLGARGRGFSWAYPTYRTPSINQLARSAHQAMAQMQNAMESRQNPPSSRA
jgi:hypothetical protein